MKATYNKDIEIQRLTEEIKCLKARIEILDVKERIECIDNQPSEKQHNTQQNAQDKSIIPGTGQIMKMIEEKLSDGLSTIQTNVENLINEKISQNTRKHHST